MTARGSGFLSSGRFCLFETRSISTSMSAFSQTDTPCPAIAARVLLVHEGAAAGREHLRSVLEDAGDHALFQRPELFLAIALEQIAECPCATRVSISWSLSRKGRSSAAATLRPIAVLPAPISPTKTIER